MNRCASPPLYLCIIMTMYLCTSAGIGVQVYRYINVLVYPYNFVQIYRCIHRVRTEYPQIAPTLTLVRSQTIKIHRVRTVYPQTAPTFTLLRSTDDQDTPGPHGVSSNCSYIHLTAIDRRSRYTGSARCIPILARVVVVVVVVRNHRRRRRRRANILFFRTVFNGSEGHLEAIWAPQTWKKTIRSPPRGHQARTPRYFSVYPSQPPP